ncbi:hypothetical protein RA2_03655 [Roseovarius sp. A-2]|uniref:hypothetical protein n=1 Tax=Roseovarius sp. A-2 TaxID=1570360 RepID=UPI0009B56863|nr:hypothetical protein [Roseovarius sp. A-2]GAW36582.1 hypothetical protein RA2_03655 [Roseovarius sp. A-2]
MSFESLKIPDRAPLLERLVSFLKPAPAPAQRTWEEPRQPGLATRLFRESEQRLNAVGLDSPQATAREIEMREAFTNQTVLILAKPSHNVTNLQIWLETIFGLDVTVVHDPAYFYEWLFRFAGLAGIVVIDGDSFTDLGPAFGTFLSAAGEACDESPVIVLSEKVEVNDFAPSWQDKWDITLKTPVAQTTLWLAVKTAADMALNGKPR